ncbi:MAG TPA: 1-acyl-sn-glycerol-3-phosphate acyltransferase [Candidatus Phocaeicola excrementigallinarum]|nr:1-acyl-sn-glycerol-3-phosphate acyltransferase [Candidatus Phocaeicola excrementigallinarum]
MKQSICRLIYFKLLGWKAKVSVPDFKKCIICAAPHTTNWDLIIGKLFIAAVGRSSGFLMKKEWFFFPLGALFRRMGGIPVHRDKHTSMVDQLIEQVRQSDTFHLAITPEGTRSANPEWKKGFYYIALGARIPIVLIGIDYEKKCIVAEKYLIPDGDIEKDMKEIKLYFKDFKGKYPEKFDIGEV